MDINKALDIINNDLIYRPGTTFTATDHTKRFENSIKVRVGYHAYNTDREMARLGFPQEIDTYAEFVIMLDEIPDELALLAKVLEALEEIEMHEAAEFLRRPSLDFDAPFHPHRTQGINNFVQFFGGSESDHVKFGVV